MSHLKGEIFDEFASYFKDKNISNARMKFRFRTKMTKNIPGNFKNNFKYNQADMLCSFCTVDITQECLIICQKRSKFREDLDMNNLDDMITYIRGRPYRWQEIILMTMTRLTHCFPVWNRWGLLVCWNLVVTLFR